MQSQIGVFRKLFVSMVSGRESVNYRGQEEATPKQINAFGQAMDIVLQHKSLGHNYQFRISNTQSHKRNTYGEYDYTVGENSVALHGTVGSSYSPLTITREGSTMNIKYEQRASAYSPLDINLILNTNGNWELGKATDGLLHSPPSTAILARVLEIAEEADNHLLNAETPGR